MGLLRLLAGGGKPRPYKRGMLGPPAWRMYGRPWWPPAGGGTPRPYKPMVAGEPHRNKKQDESIPHDSVRHLS